MEIPSYEIRRLLDGSADDSDYEFVRRWLDGGEARRMNDSADALAAATARAEAAERERDQYRAKFREAEDDLIQWRKWLQDATARGDIAVARNVAAEAKLAMVDRYGADQWRRGRDQDPQEFDEWMAQQGMVQP